HHHLNRPLAELRRVRARRILLPVHGELSFENFALRASRGGSDLREVQMLARMKCSGVEIDEDVLTEVLRAANGRARRIVVILGQIREDAALRGKDRCTMADAERIRFYTGDAPAPRGGR
ncbi:hypothetical protein, partial [Chachezhania sediminis]|uniref:hypothetical protein n=1 Tax=Chachezhania sediminis TaxID=2599291 RepID=UPI0018EF2A50